MVGSELLYAPVYGAIWKLAGKLGRQIPLAFYCPEEIDLLCFEPVARHLPRLVYLSGDRSIQAALTRKGLPNRNTLSFPQALIMSRHALHRFPCRNIISIGMRHGPYHFKRMTKAENYNRFGLYLFSSRADLEAARELGVKVGKAVGFPKLDPAFDGSITEPQLLAQKKLWGIDPSKPTLLFTSTWNGSGMSAIGIWLPRLREIIPRWNVLVTLHPWVSASYRKALSRMRGVNVVKQVDLLKAMLCADVCVGDQSSILAECCALDKGMVTFRTPPAARSLAQIDELLERISLRISGFDELEPACERFLIDPSLLSQQRAEANRLMFDTLDGQAGKRAAAAILDYLREKGFQC